jgi:hypothetical protein
MHGQRHTAATEAELDGFAEQLLHLSCFFA